MVTVAAVQATPVFLDRQATVDKVCALVAEAADGGAELIVFGESFVPAYPDWVWRTPAWRDGPFVKRLYANAVSVPGPDLDRIAGDRVTGLAGKLTLHQWLSLMLNTGSYFGIGTPLGFTTLMHRRQHRFWDTVALLNPGRAFALKGTDYIGGRLPNGDYALKVTQERIPLFWAPGGIDFFTGEREALRRIATRA